MPTFVGSRCLHGQIMTSEDCLRLRHSPLQHINALFLGVRKPMIAVAVFDPSLMFKHGGVAIAGTGLLIVFAALILITLFIAALPRILEAVAQVLPEVPDRHATIDTSGTLLPDEAVLAAIGFVLHHELQKQDENSGKIS